METLIAYKGDTQLKEMLVEEIKKHREADEIKQGSYGNGDGPWCAVGCAIHSLNVRLHKDISTSDHSASETELGIPRIIARLEDRIFEGLDKKDAPDFPLRFAESINVGANLSLVWPKFAVWLLGDENDGVLKYAKKEASIIAIKKVIELYQKVIDGGTVEKSEWKTAAAAAAAYAAAAYAADADAYAAYAAAYAAYAAAAYAAYAADAYAAYAADADADAADAADADAAYAAAAYAAYAYADAYAADAAYAAAARKIHYGKCADKLIEILKETK